MSKSSEAEERILLSTMWSSLGGETNKTLSKEVIRAFMIAVEGVKITAGLAQMDLKSLEKLKMVTFTLIVRKFQSISNYFTSTELDLLDLENSQEMQKQDKMPSLIAHFSHKFQKLLRTMHKTTDNEWLKGIVKS